VIIGASVTTKGYNLDIGAASAAGQDVEHQDDLRRGCRNEHHENGYRFFVLAPNGASHARPRFYAVKQSAGRRFRDRTSNAFT
jgi:hypothetical protein